MGYMAFQNSFPSFLPTVFKLCSTILPALKCINVINIKAGIYFDYLTLFCKISYKCARLSTSKPVCDIVNNIEHYLLKASIIHDFGPSEEEKILQRRRIILSLIMH
jgi:hypothetical protein